jgi:hypothetical protein
MRDQYAGDISDILKFAFLRALARTDRLLGIAWYYAPGDDGRADGRHLEWHDEPAWQRLDAQAHAALSSLPERNIAALESAAMWPNGIIFHREPMPSQALRNAWSSRKRTALCSADIVFLDPDNGLGKEIAKHATFAEVRLLRRPGRAVVFITFPARKTHNEQVRQLHNQLVVEADAGRVITLRTNISVPSTKGSRFYVQRPRWFTVVDPDAELVVRVRRFADALLAIPRVSVRLDDTLDTP